MLGLLAWYCGDVAAGYIPKKSPIQLDTLSHYYTVFLFRPGVFLLPLFFFLISFKILSHLLKNHANAILNRRGLNDIEQLLHASVLSFSLFVLVIQAIKTPLPVILYFTGLFLVKLFRHFRHRSLQTEIAQITGKK